MGGLIAAILAFVNIFTLQITYNMVVARFIRKLYTIPGSTDDEWQRNGKIPCLNEELEIEKPNEEHDGGKHGDEDCQKGLIAN